MDRHKRGGTILRSGHEGKNQGRLPARQKLQVLSPHPCEEYEYEAELKSLVQAFPKNVAYKVFATDEFETQAPSEYIILNPDGDGDLRVLVKLPLGEHGQQEFWFETNDRSARSFVSRFRKLWEGSPAPVAGV